MESGFAESDSSLQFGSVESAAHGSRDEAVTPSPREGIVPALVPALDGVIAALDEAVVIHDSAGILAFANPAAARLFGVSGPQQLVGMSIDDVFEACRIFDERGVELTRDRFIALRDHTETDVEPPVLHVSIAATGRDTWLRARIRRVDLADDPGRSFTVTALEDLTRLKNEEVSQSLLARAGELLSEPDGYEGILRRLTEVPVPSLADCCVVDVVAPDGSWRRAGHTDQTVDRVELPAADGKVARDDDSLAELDLCVGGRKVGRVIIANEVLGRTIGAHGREIMGRILDRAGIALENARLAAERAEIAAGLQEGLIPPPLPEVPGWDVAALYRPAGEQAEVGGDFYEAFRIKRGWMIMLGDVTGRGPRAASVTAQARYTLRTAGILSRDPRAALSALNRALLARAGSPLCSAVVVVLHEGSRRADIVVAGHPLPLRVRDQGGVEEVGVAGPVLGAFESANWPVSKITIDDLERLVLYTDGVTEASSRGERFGADRFRGLLAPSGAPAAILTRAEVALEEFCRQGLADDVAILVVTPEQTVTSVEGPDVDLVARAFEAFQRRSLQQLIELSAESVEVEVPDVAATGGGTTYRGHDGLKECFDALEQTWDDLIITPRRFTRMGDRVLVKGRLYARGRPLGIRDVGMSWIWEVGKDGIESCRAQPEMGASVSFTE